LKAKAEPGIVRAAVAGLGRSGYGIHAVCIRKQPEQFQIVAAADQLAERRRDAEEEFNARVYPDWKPLLADGDFDLFINALPSPLHVPATIAALKAGKHVLCEKPMAAKVRDFDRMAAAAKQNKRVLYPFQNNRLQPFFDKLREVLASGVLGKLVYVCSYWGGFRRRWDWQAWQDNLGGSLFNTGPHAIDQALALFGWKTPKVFCRMDCNNAFGADAEDHCTVTLYDPKRAGPQIDIVISEYLAYAQGEFYNIGGTYGGLTGGATELHWRYFDPKQAPKQKMWKWSVDRQYNSEKLPWVEESWKLDETQAKNAVGYTLESFPIGPERIYADLYEVLTGNAKPLITLAQVRKQIAVLEECHRQNPLPRKR
jgi:predicted dehydrogenase